MIHKTKYFFIADSFVSPYKETVEELKQTIIEYKKENPDEQCLVYKMETFLVLDKHGNIVYDGQFKIRDYNTEDEVI